MFDPHPIIAFLEELKANNDRSWFEANKPRYQALRAGFAMAVEDIVHSLAEVDERLLDVAPESTIFRIYRDLRFSKDKTPFKTNFSAAPGAKSGRGPGYYFEITAEGSWGVGSGSWMPSPEEGTRIRQAIAAQPVRVTQILDAPPLREAFPGGVYGECYKRPPKGFDENTPRLDLILHKGFALWHDEPVTAAMDGRAFIERVSQSLSASAPWVDFLRGALHK